MGSILFLEDLLAFFGFFFFIIKNDAGHNVFEYTLNCSEEHWASTQTTFPMQHSYKQFDVNSKRLNYGLYAVTTRNGPNSMQDDSNKLRKIAKKELTDYAVAMLYGE